MDKVGLITATFHACWPRNGLPPQDEPSYDIWVQNQRYGHHNPLITGSAGPGQTVQGSAGSGQTYGGSAPNQEDISTGRGDSFQNQTRYFPREFGVARGVVALRYKQK